jgi:Phospholipase_D-nuclease N-terminal
MEASFTIVFLLLVAATTALWIWALVDVLRRPAGAYRSGSQLVWVLVIALTHSIGAVVYLLIGRPRTTAPAGAVGR